MKFFRIFTISAASLILLFIGIGLVSPTTSYTIEFEVDKPIDVTYLGFTSVKLLPYWISGYGKIEHLTGDGESEGSKFILSYNGTGESFYFVQNIEFMRHFDIYSFSQENEMMKSDNRFTFKELTENKTIVKLSVTISGKGLITRSMFPIIKGKLIKQNTKDLRKLISIIEK